MVIFPTGIGAGTGAGRTGAGVGTFAGKATGLRVACMATGAGVGRRIGIDTGASVGCGTGAGFVPVLRYSSQLAIMSVRWPDVKWSVQES
jgi:hypothetical protein